MINYVLIKKKEICVAQRKIGRQKYRNEKEKKIANSGKDRDRERGGVK